ncbi:MAG: hypothetical protein KDB01_20015 [Planctomycetaceae bacterium]|nr:hypothetical protein [Planctomycetaceae bacterium]
MTAVVSAKGRVLSGQQVRFNDAPIRLANQPRCAPAADRITLETDPVTGDVTCITVRCECGEVIKLECEYSNNTPQ